jgi:single-strand DNA-binding protein
MNNVALIGRLTRDPEVRYTSGTQMAVARFTIAVDRQFKRDGEPTADFIPIVAFGKTAELCERYISKGRQVAVEGRIQTGSYTNKDGNKVYTTDVVANRVEFLEWGDRAGSGSGFGMGQSSAPQSDMGIPEGFSAIDDDDIPF